MEEKSIRNVTRSFINMNQLFTTILEDVDMTKEFVIDEEEHE